MKRNLLLLAATIALVFAFTNCSSDDKEFTSSENKIESFVVNGTPANFNHEKNLVELIFHSAEDVDLAKVTPVINVSQGATVSPASGVVQDFSNLQPKTYTVTAQDGTTREYTVVVTTDELTVAYISEFSFELKSQTIKGLVNYDEKTVTVTVPHGTDVTKLIPTIEFGGEKISPDLGKEVDFTKPVIYTVTPKGGLPVEYTVTVSIAADYFLEKTDGTVIGRGEEMILKGRFAKEGNVVKVEPRYSDWANSHVVAKIVSENESEIKFIIPNGDKYGEKALYGYNNVAVEIDGIRVTTNTEQEFDFVVPNPEVSGPLQLTIPEQKEYVMGLSPSGSKSKLEIFVSSPGALGKSDDSQAVAILTNKKTKETHMFSSIGSRSSEGKISALKVIFTKEFIPGEYTVEFNVAGIASTPFDITVKDYPYEVPVVESFSSYEIKKSDVITIKGKNFTQLEEPDRDPNIMVQYRYNNETPIEEVPETSFRLLGSAKVISKSDTELKISIEDIDLKGHTILALNVVVNNSSSKYTEIKVVE